MTDQMDVVFGIHAVADLIANRPNEVECLYFDKARATSGKTYAMLKMCRKQKINCRCIPGIGLAKMAGTTKHQGVAALCSVKPYDSIENVLERVGSQKSPPVLLIPASIEDPGNLGAIIRSGAAFGVAAVLVERSHTAPLSRAVAKAAAGTLERMPVARPTNLAAHIENLRSQGYRIVGATAGADAKPQDIDLTGPTAIILGGEHRDIPPYLKRVCSDLVVIPSVPGAETLNVAAAGAILLYEVARQRGYAF